MSRRVRVSVPCGCAGGGRSTAGADSAGSLPKALRCPLCGSERPVRTEGTSAEGGLLACLACGHPELYTRKRFPPIAGLSVIAAAAVLAPATHYASLLIAAVIDAVLYRALPDVVVCYACGAEHTGFAPEPRHPRFDREIAERLKYGPRAVMGRPMREGGTAGGPDPEH